MKKGLLEMYAEQQRVIILQLLNEDADCCLNMQLLQKGLEMFGHAVSMDKVRIEVAWLEEAGCVTTEEEESITLVSLTEKGLDVVQRRTIVPGIDRPLRGI